MRLTVSAIALLATLSAAPFTLHAQAFASAGSVDVASSADGSVPAAASVPTDRNAKKDWKKAKADAKKEEKKVKDTAFNASIRDGVYSVDGMVAKVQLNYDVKDAHFLYFYLPGAGTAVVSREKMPDAAEVKDGMKGNALAFSVASHDFRLESKDNLMGKDGSTVYVRFDAEGTATNLGQYPMMGFGTIPQAPYAWPGALAADSATQTASDTGIKAPPIPQSMLPRRISISGGMAPAPQTAAIVAAK